jgi:8-oxo-dGTP pyrophosphatase MutT (NUDIX family)
MVSAIFYHEAYTRFVMQSRSSLIKAIQAYKTSYREEIAFVEKFIGLLNHPRSFQRDHLPGHITGSAWIIDPQKEFVLLTHHAKLNRWLQPGGHADGDEDIIRVASREADEETGLKSLSLLSDKIFDLDIHTIPARKDFSEHLHFDIRLLFQASMDEPLILTEESHELKWFPVTAIQTISANNQSMMRMAEKVKAI